MQLIQITNKLHIFKVQRTCVYDGPGIRTTIFFQGCGLGCLWCQNPEGQPMHSENIEECGYSQEELLELVLRDKEYYDATSGGVTLSGGEPFLQDPKTLELFLKELHENQIHITVETSLFAPWKNIEPLLTLVDLFIVDLKVIGDDNLHQRLTKQSFTLIHQNLDKLLNHNMNLKLRMVMVPSLNDSPQALEAAVNFLKDRNINEIELMKYHNLYEDKINRLELVQTPLEISPEESLQSLVGGLKYFREHDIHAINIDEDYKNTKTKESTAHPKFTNRVLQVQNEIRTAKRALCIEAAKLRTKYYRKNGFKKPVHIHRAERIAYILDHKKINIYPDELIVGNFTSKRVSGQLWEEYYGELYILFLYKINRLKPVAFQSSLKDHLYYYTRIFPFWYNHNLIRKTYPSLNEFIIGMSRNAELVAGFLNNLAAIAHYVVNFDRILELGTTGLIKEIREIQKAHPNNNQDFYDATVIALEGLGRFGDRYAEELIKISQKEKNPARKSELEAMARICRRVPKYPAESFHEALQSMMFLHIALCVDAYENAVSFGRLDQLLYPYYKRDLEAGLITYEKAQELLNLFILKIDELILVNDGDTFMNLSNLFETLSTDQAVTFGGVDKDGKDATNPITYMLIDACELQTLSLDMGARVHGKSPQKYLNRLAEVYLDGCPMPQLFSDETYIQSILHHYPTTLENARDYSIVGCVEPTASNDHFGNTDCANINLPMPFLQALKGTDYDLWNHKLLDHYLLLILSFVKFVFKTKWMDKIINKIFHLRNIKHGHYNYRPVENMNELLERFQQRLNSVAKSILLDHQKIEANLRTYFTTPLTSALYKGCLERGKDVYEGGCDFNSSGIQAVGVTDVADSLYAIDEIIFKQKKYSVNFLINALDNNFQQKKYQKLRKQLLAVPKFGDDGPTKSSEWMNKVLDMYNKALDSVPHPPRGGRYSAGYYALNVCNRYGKNTPALPSGRLHGEPLANSITPHYGMEQSDLNSALNSLAHIDFVEHAENGTTATFTIDSALFLGEDGKESLANMFKTYLTTGGMQLQPNVISREILVDAYDHPDKYPFLLVRIAGYCAYFNELSDEMKRIVINRTCYH